MSSSPAAAAAGASAKRKYAAHHNQQNPKRGGPGVLLTCETGREKKCRQEALDILNYYYYRQEHIKRSNDGVQTNNDAGDVLNTKQEKPLSFDEEIKELRSQNHKLKQIFSPYDTGVRGTITLLCTLPDAVIIPPPSFVKQTHCHSLSSVSKPSESVNDNSDEDVVAQEPEAKKVKRDINHEKSPQSTLSGSSSLQQEATKEPQQNKPLSLLWDPIRTVQRILDDLRQDDDDGGNGGSVLPPSSRFVTRMIPIQVSCFANETEICHYAKELFQFTSARKEEMTKTTATTATATTTNMPFLEKSSETTTTASVNQTPSTNGTGATARDDKHLDSTTTGATTITFAIQVKRRICSHLKSQNVIEWIAKEAPKDWKVDLSNPKYTMIVEICKTLCGLSLVENLQSFENFNLIRAREKTLLQDKEHES